METSLVLEIVGYVASGLVAVSLMMSSVLRLRVINLVGSLTFTVYGVLIEAYPVALVNALIVFINLWYLRQMLGSRPYFRLLRVGSDDEYLRYFLEFYRDQVQRYFPGFRYVPGADRQLAFFILRDMVPAGLFMGELRGDGTLRVLLDFVIPQYRDFKTGRYLFRDGADTLREFGVREVVSAPGNREHADYLRRMGFAAADPADPDAPYRLPIG